MLHAGKQQQVVGQSDPKAAEQATHDIADRA